MVSLGSIRNRVRMLSIVDPARTVFGAHDHGYVFAPPLSSAELEALEARIGVLPAQYRAFVLEIGAAGAGPYYGLRAAAPPEDADAKRAFAWDAEVAHDVAVAAGAHLLDGTIELAEQGCGGRSLLVMNGPHAGEVWSDWTREHGGLAPEAPSLFAWYGTWLDYALVEWTTRAAPRIVLEGPDDPAELEALMFAFELVAARAPAHADASRTLGYLHARERRFEDARAAFDAAAAIANAEEPAARRHLDVARMYFAMEAHPEAIKEAERGLAEPNLWYSTCDELRDILERALGSDGRHDEALAVLDGRAAECMFSFELHHRLARERIARGDVEGAGLALERAANIEGILSRPSTLDERLAASFEPIIAELHGARRAHEGALLEALVEKIRTAN